MNLKKYVLSGLVAVVLMPSLSFSMDQRPQLEQKVQADQKEALEKARANDNQRVVKKVAANVAAAGIGYFAGYLSKRMGQLMQNQPRHETSVVDLLAAIVLLAAPFYIATEMNAMWSTTALGWIAGTIL